MAQIQHCCFSSTSQSQLGRIVLVEKLVVILFEQRIVLDDCVSKQHRRRDDRIDIDWLDAENFPGTRINWGKLFLGGERRRREGNVGGCSGNDRRWL